MNGSEQNVLERLHKKGITATDIATQFWCEKQMELNCLHKPMPTKAMEKGARMHEVWQAKVYVPLTVEPQTYSDVMFKIAYENYTTLQKLKSEKIGRELMVYGSMNGYRFSGKIDELRIKENRVVIVEDKTVSRSMAVDEPHTRPHVVQIMLYRKMLGDIKERLYTYDNFSNTYKLKGTKLSEEFVKGLRSIGLKDEYLNLESMYSRMFQEMEEMPELSDELEIRYTDRKTNETVADLGIKYDHAVIAKDLSYAMQYWRGEREAAPVAESENWKCKPCKFFGNRCKVWWTGG